MDANNIPAKICEAIHTKNLEEVRKAIAPLNSDELKRALREKNNNETALALAFKLDLREILVLLIQRSLPNTPKYSTLASIDILDDKNQSKYWRILFDLMDAFCHRMGTERVKSSDLVAEFRSWKPYMANVNIDLSQLIEKPKYLVAALRLGADPGPKSKDSWMCKLLNIGRIQKQQAMKSLEEMDLLPKNILPVQIWSQTCAQMGFSTASLKLRSLIAKNFAEIDEETGNNALHYVIKYCFPRGFNNLCDLFRDRIKDNPQEFVDMLLHPNKNGSIPLISILENYPQQYYSFFNEELTAVQEVVLRKDVTNLRRIFSLTFAYRKKTLNFYPTLSVHKILLQHMYQCGLRYDFLIKNNIPNADLMLEIEQLHISYQNGVLENDQSKFSVEELPAEILYHIASFMRPMDAISLFNVTKATSKLLVSDRQEQIWTSISENYFPPNENRWLGTDYKNRIFQTAQASQNWQNQKYKTVLELQHVAPILMDENCLVLEDAYATKFKFWDCHSQKMFGEVARPEPYPFRPVKILDQNGPNEIPTMLGYTNQSTRAAVFRDGQFYQLNAVMTVEGAAKVDPNTLLLSNGRLYDLVAEEWIRDIVPAESQFSMPYRLTYNPFNRTAIATLGWRPEKLLVMDLNGQKVAEFDRYIGNYIFYPIDEYTILYNTFGGKQRVLSNAIGQIDLRTGKDIVRIDGLLHCSRYPARVLTSERLLFYNTNTQLQSSWNVRQCKWEYVEKTDCVAHCANTRYSTHTKGFYSKHCEVRDYCFK